MQLFEWKQHTPIVTCTKFQASLAKTSHALERWPRQVSMTEKVSMTESIPVLDAATMHSLPIL